MVDRVGVNVPERTCSKCGESKPETEEFFRKRGTKDRGGLRPDCRICSTTRDREYHQRARTARLAQRAEWRAQNQHVTAERERRYMATDTGRAVRRRNSDRYRTEHPEVLVLSRQKRRAAMAGTEADFTRTQWDACRDAFQHHCAYCDQYRPLTQDHVVALSAGGRHTAANVIPACGSCNSRKFRTPMEQWFRAQEFFTDARLDFIHAYVQRFTAAAA